MTIFDSLEKTRPYHAVRAGMNARLVNFFQRHVFSGRQNLYVAEVAAGSGYASHLIAQLDGVGLSLAADLNRIYFEQAAIPDFAASFVLSDLFMPAFQPASFDLVWNSSSLEHFADPQVALEAMASLAKPGGYIFVGVPYLFGPLAFYHLTPSQAQREWLGKPFRYAELEALFIKSGLQVEQSMVYLARCFIGILARKAS